MGGPTMELTKQALKNPAAVSVVIVVIALLGIISINKLPVQLFPNIDRPEIGVWTGWRAASPREIESEIIEPIERELRGIPGLRFMRSWSNTGGGYVHLEFSLGADMDQAFTEVTSRLQRVRGLPAEADRPRVQNNGGNESGDTLIFLFLQKLPGNSIDGFGLTQFAETQIRPEIEAIDGVGGIDVNSDYGEEAVQIVFDPFLLSQYSITVEQLAQALNRSSDVSGGTVEVGRNELTLRFEGRRSADQLENTIIAMRDQAPIRLADIADVIVGPISNGGVVYQNGNPAIGMRIFRESGANTLAAIDALTEKVNDLNENQLAEKGYMIEKSFDPSVFIKRAISLLTGNLLIGVILAIGALWVFLRRTRATLLIASAIPICLTATIVILNLFDRSINVISLAGLAFATGMVLDAAIVVLENFVRIRDNGETPQKAAELSVSQVFGALFASTTTTVAIFLPILFFEDVEGQLFADLALTIAIAVSFSLIVAITVLPTGAAIFMKKSADKTTEKTSNFAKNLSRVIMAVTNSSRKRAGWIAGLTALPLLIGWALWPQLNYLPPVKRDAVDAFVSFPSGASAGIIREEFAEIVVDRLDPYLTGEKEPSLKNYYLYSGGWGGNIGVRINDQSRINEMVDIVNNEILSGFPDTRVFAQQGNLFGNFGGGASLRIDLKAADYDALTEATPQVIDIIQSALPGSNVWPNPDPQVVNPEIRVIPNDRRIAEVGMTREQIARTIRAMGDGLWLGEFFHEAGRVDMILRATEWTQPEFLETIPVVTPSGGLVPLGELATVSLSVGPQRIQRFDAQRTISLGINTPEDIALGDAIATLRGDALSDILAALPEGANVEFAGEADALARAIRNLSSNFFLAIALLFLILAALFKSIRDAAYVIIALPMAAVGGVLALQFLNLFTQTPLDLLGMIGFIILLGLVVNNAILLVSQTRLEEKRGKPRDEAVATALSLRIRPIFMSTVTSLMGMLPLVLSPGAGSMIYRGLATVIVGGMVVSTLFTLLLLPSLLQLGSAKKQSDVTDATLVPAQ